jgi:hypothetical protein
VRIVKGWGSQTVKLNACDKWRRRRGRESRKGGEECRGAGEISTTAGSLPLLPM